MSSLMKSNIGLLNDNVERHPELSNLEVGDQRKKLRELDLGKKYQKTLKEDDEEIEKPIEEDSDDDYE